MSTEKMTPRQLMENALNWAKSQGIKTGGGQTAIVPPAGTPRDACWAYIPGLPIRTAKILKARYGSALVIRRAAK